MDDLSGDDQVSHMAALVALETGTWRRRHAEHFFPAHAFDVELRAARLLLGCRRIILFEISRLFHARRAKRRPRRQVLQSGDLIAQQLVLHLQAGIFLAQRCILFAKLRVLGAKLRDFCGELPDLTDQARDKRTQRVQR
jgi:hypothetical protein